MPQSDFYRNRWLKIFPTWLKFVASAPGFPILLKTKLFGSFLRSLENIAPADKNVVSQIKNLKPDGVLSLIANMRYESPDMDYIKAARHLGVPVAFQVASWDNLTTKGLIHIRPDVLLAWNDVQVREAEEHHRVPKKNVRIIGAPVFDFWFSDLPEPQSREEFCKERGLNPKDQILVYLGSSANIAKDETWLVLELREALNKSPDELLRNAKLVVRPHPANCKVYEKIDGSSEAHGIFIFPKTGALPNDQDSRKLLYNTLYHSAAVVGINTSAMIESVIVGKPVVSYLTDEYRKTQAEAQHFQQLLAENVLEVVKTPEEFVEVAGKLIAGKDTHKKEREAFVKKFIRPLGFEKLAGEAAADEIEKMIYGK